MTLGGEGDEKKWPYAGSIGAAEGFGNQVARVDVDKIIIDDEHRVVTTPAYMRGDAKPHQVFEGVEKMVKALIKMAKSN